MRLECETCGKYMKNENTAMIHTTETEHNKFKYAENGERVLECKICGEIVKNEDDMINHRDKTAHVRFKVKKNN